MPQPKKPTTKKTTTPKPKTPTTKQWRTAARNTQTGQLISEIIVQATTPQNAATKMADTLKTSQHTQARIKVYAQGSDTIAHDQDWTP